MDSIKLEDIIYYEADASKKLMAGIDKLANAIKVTMGPSGRSVILGGSGQLPVITKDGVSVANYLTLVDPIEDMGAQIVKQAASNTVSDAGDGTTTSTVLTQRMCHEFIKHKYSNKFKEGVQKATEDVITSLKEGYKQECDTLEDLAFIALTSSNGDTGLSDIVAKAVHTTGADGSVEVVVTDKKDITLEVFDGYKSSSGWISSKFINNKTDNTCKLESVLVLLVEGKIERFESILPLIKKANSIGRSFLVVADEFSADVIASAERNFLMGKKVALIRSENFAQERKFSLEDLAIYIDGDVYLDRELSGVQSLESPKFGICDSITISIDSTVFVRDTNIKRTKIDERLKSLVKLKDAAKSENNRDKINSRISKLKGKSCIINIGGHTQVEIKERLDRAEDSIGATKAALREGIIPGGGTPLYKIGCELISNFDDDFNNGYNSVMKGITSPFLQIITNTGFDVNEVVNKLDLENPNEGINSITLESVDLIEEGIIDPLAVTMSALNNAISVSLLIASVGAVMQNTFVD